MLPDRIAPESAPALMTLNSLKRALGVPTTYGDCDEPMTFALEVVSSLIRGYTGRWLVRADYTDRFLGTHALDYRHGKIFLSTTEFPVHTVDEIKVNGVAVANPTLWTHRRTGILLADGIGAFDEVEVTYDGGFSPLPYDMQGTIADLVRRQLASQGVSLANMGAPAPDPAPIKSVSIGALRVEYGVSVTSGTMTGSTQGAMTEAILDEYASILQQYRHPRMLAAVPA